MEPTLRRHAVAHDACYDTPFSDRSHCDQQYLNNMLSASENSRHPFLCGIRAIRMHAVTSRFGQSSFESAQDIAIRKMHQGM